MEIKLKGIDQMPDEEINRYIQYVQEQHPGREIESLTIEVLPDGENVDLEWTMGAVSFERIRRITGYLVGTLDRFNDAKRSEVEDRVKHPLGGREEIR